MLFLDCTDLNSMIQVKRLYCSKWQSWLISVAVLGEAHGSENKLVKPVWKECCPPHPGYNSCHFFVINKEALTGKTLTLTSPFFPTTFDQKSASTNVWKYEGHHGALNIVNLLGTGKMYGSMYLKHRDMVGGILNEEFYHILPCGKGLNVLRNIDKVYFLPMREIPEANPSNFAM